MDMDTTMPHKSQHEHYMKICLELAAQARAEGNLGIGALVVKEKSVIARAHEKLPNSWDVAAHAELLALREACRHLQSRDLSGCTLYTTAEPCWMCAYAARETGLGIIVMGAATPDTGGLNSKYPILSDPAIAGWPAPPRIVSGVLAEECSVARGV